MPAAAMPGGDLTERLLHTAVWTDQMLAEAGIPVVDVPFVSVGGGIGSFVMVDYLRIAGVPTNHIRILSNIDYPWRTYEYLSRVSQLPAWERIRSDSSARADNIWGFPSYAVEEAFSRHSLRWLWQVLVEPIFADHYTPPAGLVFQGMEREANRIRYREMLRRGQVRMVRRRAGNGGGYFTILTPPAGTSATKRVAFRSRFVHLAVGYPGLKYLSDLQEYRTKHQDYVRVVNAYESHEHVYLNLRTRPQVVVVRGGGIVASRVVQRLMDERAQYRLQTRIVHILRTYYWGPHGTSVLHRRPGGSGFAYQAFTWPKGVFGGQLKNRVRHLEGAERAQAYKAMSGTTTPNKREWQRQMHEGWAGGWYVTMQGTVRSVVPGDDGRLVNYVDRPAGPTRINADYVIDCTGLEADIDEHRVLADLLEHGGAGRNPMKRLDVEPNFEVRGTRSGYGALYASGSATVGGYFPAVDSFFGFQLASQSIADDLARRGFCARIGPLRSISQWLKWVSNVRI